MSRKHREFLYHATALAFFAYTDVTSITIPGHNNTYGGRYKFLTVLNLKLLILYYGWSTVMDLTYIFWSGVSHASKVNRHKFRKNCLRRDYVFTSVVFPISSTVCLLYWSIYAIKPALIQSEAARKYSPVHGFHNHAIHPAPLLTTLLECFMKQHRLSVGFWKGSVGWFVACAAYLAWILWIAYAADLWVYPFMRVMSGTAKTLFFVFVFVIEALLYRIGITITTRYWQVSDSSCDDEKSRGKIQHVQ